MSISLPQSLTDAIRLQRGSLLVRARFVRRNGLRVAAGPFAGLRYPRATLLRVPDLTARLVGSYEFELRAAVERLLARRPGVVVNAGAGDGYYAVGLVLRDPDLRVITYEADPERRRLLAAVAALNRVDGRIEIRGTCTVAELAALDLAPGAALICDVEGAEEDLVDIGSVPWLRAAPMIVESHESFRPGLTERLIERLAPTHELTRIEAEHRRLEDHPAVWELPGASAIQKEALISELRPWRTVWLAASRVPAPRGAARARASRIRTSARACRPRRGAGRARSPSPAHRPPTSFPPRSSRTVRRDPSGRRSARLRSPARW